MAGKRYEAGGISSTVAATRAASSLIALMETATRLKREAEAQGTTTLETKSGYGLTVDDESRCLEVAGAVAEEVTYLGAHVVAPEFRGQGAGLRRSRDRPDARRLRTESPLVRRLLRARRLRSRRGPGDPASGARPRARPSRAREPVVSRSRSPARRRDGRGLRGPLHPSRRGGRRCAGRSDTVATLLPGAEFSTRSPYPDARRLLDAGVLVALATRLQSRDQLHHEHAVRHRLGRAGDADDARRGRCSPPPPGGRGRFGATTSARSVPGSAATSSCWTRRPPPISPTVPASAWWLPSYVLAGCLVRAPSDNAGGRRTRRA